MRIIMSTCCASVSSRAINSGINSNNTNTNSDHEKNITQIPVQLSDNGIVSISNPIPNPNTGKSVINYNIPVSYGSAQIIFTTSEGRTIKTVDIKEKGEGQLDVDAKDLSSGIYNYTLVVDGKTIDTRKMVKSE